VGLNIGTLLSISIGLVLRNVVKKISMGTLKTSMDDLMGKAAPVERQGSPKGMARLRSDWIVPYKTKNALIFFCYFDASVSVGSVPG
jgi:hypothetical protein